MNRNQNTITSRKRTGSAAPFAGFSEEVHINNMVWSLLEDQKRLDSRYFFDATGTGLFQKIGLLRDWYPTRIELQIIKQQVIPSLPDETEVEVIQIGPGENRIIRHLISALRKKPGRDIHFIPVDFSKPALNITSEAIHTGIPGIRVTPVLTDYLNDLHITGTDIPRIFCYFGSSPCQCDGDRAEALLRLVRSRMKPGDIFLAGFDLKKPVHILEQAYHDENGLMATFAKNILNVVNRVTGAWINPGSFEYDAFYNPLNSCMEMHLKASTDLNLHLRKAGLILGMCRGETILAARARKYDEDDIGNLADLTDLKVRRIFSDEKHWFSMAEFHVN